MRLNKLAALLALLITTAANAAGWTDVTDIFLKNPSFKGNTDQGWSNTNDAWGVNIRCESMEFWSGTFNLWQDLTGLPAGRYRLSVQSYYRMADNDEAYAAHQRGTEQLTARLYAGQHQTPIVSVYSYEFPSPVGGCWSHGNHHFPNTMESAAVAFNNGAYWNTLEFEAGGNLRIGLVNEQWTYSNWCIFDNFRLEYSGEIVPVEQISLTAPKTDLVVGETVRLTATVTPENALVKTLKWQSDNITVATVSDEGTVTSLAEGTATVSATAIDESGVSASVTFTVRRNEPTAQSLVINEIMAANIDQYLSPATNFDGWAELYNSTAEPVTLAGLWLSDDPKNPRQWQLPADYPALPAGGHHLLWFDSHDLARHNAPFKLDTDGGTICISTTAGQPLVSQTYPASLDRVSYARTTDGGQQWSTTSTPTPGTSNDAAAYATSQLPAPQPSQPSQLFTGTLAVTVPIPDGATLRYTLDGTLPTPDNGHVSTGGQFSLTATTSLRLRFFADNQLASPVTSRSYILRDKDYTLPVVSVVGDPKFFYDDTIGLFVQGTNGRPGNGQERPCNWNMDWERPVNFSYLTSEGDMVLNQDVNLEMCGGWSRAWSPHSFKLKGNKELGGNKNLPYPFFDQKPYIRNRTLQIRNGGNDTQARFKDPALQYIVQTSGLDVDGQSYQPVHEFVNGQYIGVLNVREPNNKHYAYANYGWDDDEIDQFEMSPDSGYVQKCGTPDAFIELVDQLSPDAASAETYDEICRLLDVDAYANYMAVQLYLGNTDWPQNNVKGFRHSDDGRFRFVLFDLDHAFGTADPFNAFMSKETYTFDQLYPRELGRITDRIRFVSLFKNLLKNPDFRRRFIDAYCIVGGSIFETNRAIAIINQLAERVNPAMSLEYSSVNQTANTLRSNLSGRLSAATSALRNHSAFNLSATAPQRVTLDADTDGAILAINGQQIPTSRFDGHLFAPVTLQALPPAGYAFQGWLKNGAKSPNYYSTAAQITLPADNTLRLTASYRPLTAEERQSQGLTPVRINEVSASNDSYINEYGKKNDWVELYNTTDESVDIEGMYLTDNPNKLTKYQITKASTAAQTVIPPHGHLLIWCDKLETSDQALHATFKIDGEGGTLALTSADNTWTDTFSYASHDATQTVGRYPDGSSDIYLLSTPTIARPNHLSSYSLPVSGGSVSVRPVLASGTSASRLYYASQQLTIKAAPSAEALVSIYTSAGRLVFQSTVQLHNGTAQLNVSHLPPGFYVAQALFLQHTLSCKFMK